MTDFVPSGQQAAAMHAIRDWFINRTHEQQVFRVFGYAGTGKTTITRHAIAELGLGTKERDAAASTVSGIGGVLYAAFTGKAALVMTRKGTPASTIHSLIYRVSEATPRTRSSGSRRRSPTQGEAARPSIPPTGVRGSAAAQPRLRLADIHKPRFMLNEQSIVRDADLIVLDEVSMVGATMARDLLAFGKPILVLGDPGQLPPIKGEGAFTHDAARRDADRDPPPGRRERDHPARHHGPAGPADRLRRARPARLEDAAHLGRRPSRCCGAAR